MATTTTAVTTTAAAETTATTTATVATAAVETTATTTTATATTTSDVKEVEGKVGGAIRELAEYVDEKTYAKVNRELAVNKTFGKVVAGMIEEHLKQRYTGQFAFKVDPIAHTQLLIVLRMLYVSAKRHHVDDGTAPAEIVGKLAEGTMDRDLWGWFANIVSEVMRRDGSDWNAQYDSTSAAIPAELVEVLKTWDGKEEPDQQAGVAILVLVKAVAMVAIDTIGAKIDVSLDESKEVPKVVFTADELNGCMRMLNNGPRPVSMDLFKRIGRGANQYGAARKYWDEKTKTDRTAEKMAEKEAKRAKKAAEDMAKKAAKATKAPKKK